MRETVSIYPADTILRRFCGSVHNCMAFLTTRGLSPQGNTNSVVSSNKIDRDRIIRQNGSRSQIVSQRYTNNKKLTDILQSFFNDNQEHLPMEINSRPVIRSLLLDDLGVLTTGTCEIMGHIYLLDALVMKRGLESQTLSIKHAMKSFVNCFCCFYLPTSLTIWS